MLDDEQVVAWGVIPVMTGYGDMNAGTHMVPLYQIPVPEATDMPVGVHEQLSLIHLNSAQTTEFKKSRV